MTVRDAAGKHDALRRFVLSIFLVGTAGIGGELLLLGHFEDVRQWTPLALLPLGWIAVAWQRVERGPRSTHALRGAMVLFLASGFVGLWFHYSGNAEFEREMYPSIHGWELVREALTGATPALAPSAMIQLGLLGLTYTYRHPNLERETPRSGVPGRSETEER